MTTFNAYQSIDDGLRYLANRLNPIIADTLTPHLGGNEWTLILGELDRAKGRQGRIYITTDLQAQLRILTERLGKLGFPFDDHTRTVSTLGSELRILRNQWAHGDELDTQDALRGHDFCVRLLEHFADWEGVKHARDLYNEAFEALAHERGITAPDIAPPAPPVATVVPDTALSASAEPVAVVPAPPAAPHTLPTPPTSTTPHTPAQTNDTSEENVHPDTAVYTRVSGEQTPTIGAGRYEYEAWETIRVGAPTDLEEIRKKTAKEKVRSIATEIAEFEGPIALTRLVKLVALAFDVQRLADRRAKQLERQVKQCGLTVDSHGFVWPSDASPDTWDEFRPNDSAAGREFTEISPVEIANAYLFFNITQPELRGADLDAAVLRTFGRKRRTPRVVRHLNVAKDAALKVAAQGRGLTAKVSAVDVVSEASGSSAIGAGSPVEKSSALESDRAAQKGNVGAMPEAALTKLDPAQVVPPRAVPVQAASSASANAAPAASPNPTPSVSATGHAPAQPASAQPASPHAAPTASPNPTPSVSATGHAPASEAGILRMTYMGMVAYAQAVPGGFMLLAGSQVRPFDQIPSGTLQRIIDQRCQYAHLISDDNRVVEDIQFRSPSGAASFVSGVSTNGHLAWQEN